MARTSFLNINGYDVPCPRYGFEYQISTSVDAGRNLNNQVVGQKIGRDIIKFNNLSWVGLDTSVREKILSIIDANFFVKVTFEDCRTGGVNTLTMYAGDRTYKPLFVDPNTHMISADESLSFNLIDCGW